TLPSSASGGGQGILPPALKCHRALPGFDPGIGRTTEYPRCLPDGPANPRISSPEGNTTISHIKPIGNGLRDILPYLCKELTGTIRLTDIGVAARRPRFALVAAQRIGGDDDDRNGAQYRIGLEATSHLISIEHRNLNIHQDEIGSLVLGHRE